LFDLLLVAQHSATKISCLFKKNIKFNNIKTLYRPRIEEGMGQGGHRLLIDRQYVELGMDQIHVCSTL
jgi:hypothetical protein